MYQFPEFEKVAVTDYIFLTPDYYLKTHIDELTAAVGERPSAQVADLIFIPGCARPEHTEEAARLYRQGFAPLVIPSGGYTKVEGGFQGVKSEEAARRYGTDFSCEADFLAEVLRKNGVPESAILKEQTATYTLENAEKTRRLLEEKGYQIISPKDAEFVCRDREDVSRGSKKEAEDAKTISTAILCCKEYHARRAYFYYKLVFPELKILVHPVAIDGISREDWDQTDKGREIVFGELRRMGEQLLMMEGRIHYHSF